ncbi:MAG TPA: 3',5'-cyclic-nucleotide phosphodiesterase [Puia sp.]|nr:3',5'-cyclic-nucleotide phosphodiesterase [Puia sp.]
MNLKYLFLFAFLFCSTRNLFSQNLPAFKIIPLGVKGGSDESNLSSYMVAPINSENYICLDAGTLHAGIQKAIEKDLLKGSANAILRNNVKAYLISHPHLDHVAGLIINSPDDSSKNIYALPFCLDVFKSNYFTWKNWANFANEGDKPALGKYHYISLDTAKETHIENTEMFVQPFMLSHSNPYKSTAFLIRKNSAYLLYLGDTGSDEIEKADNLSLLWQAVAPLIQSKTLKAIFIETSFPDEQSTKQLFGHLTPALLISEMKSLSKFTGTDALKNFPVIVTHMKPSSNNAEAKIESELITENSLGLHLVFPKQAEKFEF